jgi:hypothetical protein
MVCDRKGAGNFFGLYLYTVLTVITLIKCSQRLLTPPLANATCSIIAGLPAN